MACDGTGDILVVEDDADIRFMYHASLGPIAARIEQAESLAQARSTLARFRPDAVILDLGLPDGNGAELLDDIPTEAAVIVISAWPAREIERALTDRRSVFAHLPKPFSPNILKDIVRVALREAHV